MARQIVLLALIFVAVVGLVSGEAPAAAPTASATAPVSSTTSTPSPTSSPPVPGPDSDDIGTNDLSPSSDVVDAPVGGPVPDGAFADSGPSAVLADSPTDSKSGATVLEFSAIAGVAAIASFLF